MKKKFFLILFVFLIIFQLISCDKDKEGSAEDNTSKEQEQVATLKGEPYEKDDFVMTIAEGFSRLDIDGGVQAYKGNDMIEVWVRGYNNTETDAKNGAENLSKTYKGTEPQKTNIFGIDFYHTSIEAFGRPQTVYVGIYNGKKVQIALSGKDYQNDKFLQGMFNSITFK